MIQFDCLLDSEDMASTLRSSFYKWHWFAADPGKDYCTGSH